MKTIINKNLNIESTYINGCPINLFFIEECFYLVKKQVVNSDFKTIIEANEVIKISYSNTSVIREDCRSLCLEFYNFKGKLKSTTIYIDGNPADFEKFVKTTFISIDSIFNKTVCRNCKEKCRPIVTGMMCNKCFCEL